MVTECCSQAGIDPKDTIVVGDAIYDMQMAKSAGAAAIGVSWGYASVSELIEAGADHIAHVPRDILDWMETYHG
jgi:phosphoglycolate phosphatase